jgi:hypothetical protein
LVSAQADRPFTRPLGGGGRLAFTFERLAATYRRMAERTHSRHEAARLLGHVARLEDEAKHERLEAIRLQHLVEP